MYLNYWGLHIPPFENVPNTQLYFPSPQHEEALSRLLFAVVQRKGVAMLTGEVGSGKTTVSRTFIHELVERGYEINTIINPALDPVDFLRAILISLSEEEVGDSKPVLLSRIRNRLQEIHAKGLRTILVIDEAHVIGNSATFEEIRMLLNMQSDDHFLLNMLLLGQPALKEKVQALQPLQERISVRYHLEPLDRLQTTRYILYRLQKAGAKRGIFTKDAVERIFDYSHGNPLRINNICDRSLLAGMLQKANIVGPTIVTKALEDLG